MIAGYACWLEVLYFRMFSRSESKYSLLLLLTLLLWYYWNTYNSKPFHPPPVRSAGRTFSAANCCTLFSFSPSLASRAFRWHHFWRWILTDADWSSLWLVIPTVEKTLEILKICNRENGRREPFISRCIDGDNYRGRTPRVYEYCISFDSISMPARSSLFAIT